jgi:hypothetical protein
MMISSHHLTSSISSICAIILLIIIFLLAFLAGAYFSLVIYISWFPMKIILSDALCGRKIGQAKLQTGNSANKDKNNGERKRRFTAKGERQSTTTALPLTHRAPMYTPCKRERAVCAFILLILGVQREKAPITLSHTRTQRYSLSLTSAHKL